jgi:hypothetical protein
MQNECSVTVVIEGLAKWIEKKGTDALRDLSSDREAQREAVVRPTLTCSLWRGQNPFESKLLTYVVLEDFLR